MQITYSYEGAGHELRKDQAAMDYSFMLPAEQDPRLFHIDALASQGVPSGNKVTPCPSHSISVESLLIQWVMAGETFGKALYLLRSMQSKAP